MASDVLAEQYTLLMERLPVFVYGSLRPGQPAADLLTDRSRHLGTATLADHALYQRGPYASFPYLVPRPGYRAVGDVMVLDTDQYAATLADLDRFEGFYPDRPESSHYVRTRVTVTLRGGHNVAAWVYVASPGVADTIVAYGTPVSGGDWADGRRRPGG